MKAIIPAAGQGTRLYPQTHTKPKAMVRLAGKPILGHILSRFEKTAIDEVVIVVGGPMKEQITEYASNTFRDRFQLHFVNQENAKGLGHSIYQTEEVIGDEPVVIALGDMLFENGYESFLKAHEKLGPSRGSIGVKRVDEPQHYGIAEVADGDRIVNLVEKPDDPPSDKAISGIYIIEDTSALFDALQYIMKNDVRSAGDEYQLTDALQLMIENDSDLRTFEVKDWYDCGRPDTLLEANRVLLSKLPTNPADQLDTSVVIPPVDFGCDVTVESSVIGPYVSVDDGAEIVNSIVRRSIVGHEAVLHGVNMEDSIVGDNTSVRGEANHLNVGDNNSINL